MTAKLTEDDIEKLFSGAPQFFARNESHFYGAPHPSVAFLYDEELEIRDLADHVQIEDKAWGAITAWPHLTRDIDHDAVAKRQAQERHKSHFHVKCRERPNMLSMQGLEKGTMGYQAALELPVGDSLEEEQFGFESLGTKAKVIVEARTQMLSHHGMLHRISEPDILDRLKRNGEIYRHNDLRAKTSAETYKDLFHNFMRPISAASDSVDHHGLHNQIRALLRCLGYANVWIDFSRVEWRIRLGQVLWGENDGDELDDDTHIHDTDDTRERAEERYWLLLQILVATELLVRLDAVTEGIEYGVGGIRPIDVVHFERAASQTVKWSLFLARSWLENIDVVKEENLVPARPPMPSRNSSWLASLATKVTNKYFKQSETNPYHYTIKGRHGQRQVDGLTHFAKKLMWPGIDRYEVKISEHAQHVADETGELQCSQNLSVSSQPSSMFGAWDITSHHGKPKAKAQTQRRRLAAYLNESGWLTKSYVFGLVIPGDSMYHYLMAALLENDSDAMAKLGSFASLSSGFVYEGKSFWSSSCIVGRVLAAGKGSAECMGWISTDVVPEGMSDGWLTVDVEDVAEDIGALGRKARLWGKKKVERESSIFGNGKESNLQPSDFTIPHENIYASPPPMVYVELLSLDLSSTSSDFVPATPLSELVPTPTREHHSKAPEVVSHPAKIKFFVSLGAGMEEEVTYPLTYDINFVTAHPCAPSQRVRVLKSPASPTARKFEALGEILEQSSRPAFRTGHPLHNWYQYSVVHISELIAKPRTTLSEFLVDPMQGMSGSNRVLVVDCITGFAEQPQLAWMERVATPSSSPITDRKGSFSAAARMHLESQKRQFGSDMEILVRAICSQRGWNAIISRRKRSCLACAVREAGALGWKVIIRVP